MKRQILAVASLVSIVAALYFALIYAPTEATMGTLQRSFYFHLPQAIASYVFAILLGFGSLMYLIKRDLKWDRFAYCTAELGILSGCLTLLTGMVWGRLAWNTWWAGDARTNLELILVLLFVGYLMLRGYLPEREQRARLSTVFGFLAVLDVPINYGAIYWWNTMHPKPVFGPSGGGADPDIALTMIVCLTAFGLLYSALLLQRMAIAKIEDEVDHLEAMVDAV